MLLQLRRRLLALTLHLLRWQLLRMKTPLLYNRHTVPQRCDGLLRRGVVPLRANVIREDFLHPLRSLRLLVQSSAALLHDYCILVAALKR
jgi:hypothetical protein